MASNAVGKLKTLSPCLRQNMPLSEKSSPARARGHDLGLSWILWNRPSLMTSLASTKVEATESQLGAIQAAGLVIYISQPISILFHGWNCVINL